MPKRQRFWDGKSVHATIIDDRYDRRNHELALTDGAMRKLALSLMRLKQTTFALPDEVQEILDAVNYITIGDPVSNAAHSQMEAGKGMTPDGGYKQPEQPYAAYARGISDSGSAAQQQPFPAPPSDGAGFIRPEDKR